MKVKKMAGLCSVIALVANLSFAAEPSPKPGRMKEPTKEQRQKMAELHEKMANCLKSDRAVSECRKEMMQSCKETMGNDGCPMGGMMHGKRGHGMHHHEMEN